MPLTEQAELASQLIKKLRSVEENLDKIVKEIALTKEVSNSFYSAINVRIRREFETARAITKEWTLNKFPAYYSGAIKKELRRIKQMRIPGLKSVDIANFINKDSTKQSIAAMLNETLTTYANGFLQGENTLIRLTRYTQQVNVNEKKMNQLVQEGFEKGIGVDEKYAGTVRGSSMRLREELLKKSIDGKHIIIVDRNGKPTSWKINTYADMVAKAKLHELQTQAVIDAAVAVGGDLVQIDAHNSDDEDCSYYEGKIFSLSGTDPDFPPVEELPPYHPNCKHNISVVFRSALIADGTLEDYIEFSNDDSGELNHPTRPSFIPVSERGIKE